MSERKLFRAEAVAFQQHNRQWGQVSVLQPVPTGLTTWFIVAAIGLITAFLYFGSYARKETVTGYLRPAAGTAKIFAAQRGTIREIHVKVGQLVEQGQPLLTVQTNQVADDDKDVNATMLAALRAQKTSLARQVDAETQRGEWPPNVNACRQAANISGGRSRSCRSRSNCKAGGSSCRTISSKRLTP